MSYAACTRLHAALPILATGALAAITGGCNPARPGLNLGPADSAIVMVGYGAQPRRDVTGAIETADAEDLSERKVSHAEQQLEGRFAGLDVVREPGGGFRLRIRGASGEPLVVIDGVPSPRGVPNPLSDIPPGWIAGISILKDAGATAAYGSRGSNGVIIVTLKRPR